MDRAPVSRLPVGRATMNKWAAPAGLGLTENTCDKAICTGGLLEFFPGHLSILQLKPLLKQRPSRLEACV